MCRGCEEEAGAAFQKPCFVPTRAGRYVSERRCSTEQSISSSLGYSSVVLSCLMYFEMSYWKIDVRGGSYGKVQRGGFVLGGGVVRQWCVEGGFVLGRGVCQARRVRGGFVLRLGWCGAFCVEAS